MDWVSLLIGLASGAVGGNVAGAVMKDKSLGTLGNSIAGIVGGGAGSWILGALGLIQKTAGSGSMDLASILGSVASGGVGGGLLMAIIGLLIGKKK